MFISTIFIEVCQNTLTIMLEYICSNIVLKWKLNLNTQIEISDMKFSKKVDLVQLCGYEMK